MRYLPHYFWIALSIYVSYDIHIEDIVKNTNEDVLEDYKGLFQYVMYLDILELTYNVVTMEVRSRFVIFK